jgi:hypothetical protein
VKNILWSKVSDVSAIGNVSTLCKGYVIWAEETLGRNVILLQSQRLQTSCVAVKASDLHKITRNDPCRCIKENLSDQIAAKVVDNLWMQCLNISNKGTKDQQLNDMYPDTKACSFPLILFQAGGELANKR